MTDGSLSAGVPTKGLMGKLPEIKLNSLNFAIGSRAPWNESRAPCKQLPVKF
jgi:hypothetical protein